MVKKVAERTKSSEDTPGQPGLFGLPDQRLHMVVTFGGASHCRSELGKLVGRRLQLNMADAGQHIDHERREEQRLLAEHGTDENYDAFERARQTAANTYAKLGSQAMCDQCFGADGCPFRVIDPNTGDRAVNSSKKFEEYTANLPQSARANIKQGKLTPTTIKHSKASLHRL